MIKKISNNKIGKGLVSLGIIILLLASILAASIFYQNNITANAVKENTINNDKFQIKYVESVDELNFLNERIYELRQGFIFYDDSGNFVPLYIKVRDFYQQNGIVVVDNYGNIKLTSNDNMSGF